MALRLEAVLQRAGVDVPVALEYKMRKMEAALRRFRDNRQLWAEATESFSGRLQLQRHLAFTLFVPAGRADKARQAVELLHLHGLLPHYGKQISGKSAAIFTAIRPLVRFPQQKTDRLCHALTHWDDIVVAAVTAIGTDDVMARHARIKETVPGYGDKAAAHFMRNTGLMGGMEAIPIIDVHIKKLLAGLGLVQAGLDPAYGIWADQFNCLARMTGIPPLLLDALVWQAFADNYDMTHSDFDNFNKDNATDERPSDSAGIDPAAAHSQGPDAGTSGSDSPVPAPGGDPRDFVVRGYEYNPRGALIGINDPGAGIATPTYGITGNPRDLVAAGSGFSGPSRQG